MVVPYVAGMSEDIRRVRRKFNISETTPLKKLDWNVTDERILFEQFRHCLGSPARAAETDPVAGKTATQQQYSLGRATFFGL